MLKILDGKIVRDEIVTRLKKRIVGLSVKPKLVIIQVGDLPESNRYIKNKIKFAQEIGASCELVKFSLDTDQELIAEKIKSLNNDKTVTGLIIQLPLPKKINAEYLINLVAQEKDVDGLVDGSKFLPATARAILTLLDYYHIGVNEKNVVMMGRSRLVGQPTARALFDRGAKVTVVHRQTIEPEKITQKAEILIVAIGQPNLVGGKYLSGGQIVIDVGISVVNGKIFGDVNRVEAEKVVSALSPVPGGVGPLTVASLFENLLDACK